jgi:hypothetical protein
MYFQAIDRDCNFNEIFTFANSYRIQRTIVRRWIEINRGRYGDLSFVCLG